MKRNVLILFLLHISLISFGQKVDQSFVDFWKVFRSAVLKSDFKKLDSLTTFPLIVKGTLDDDPIKEFNKDKFQYIFKLYLKQDNGDLTGTDMDDIRKKDSISITDFKGSVPNWMRISDLQFQKVKGKWKLILIYIETAYQEENKIK